jgi:hypothetical protein
MSAGALSLGRFTKPSKGKKAKARSRGAAVSTEYNMLLTATLSVCWRWAR